MGEENILPKVDTDPVHRTTRFRQGADERCRTRVAFAAGPRWSEVPDARRVVLDHQVALVLGDTVEQLVDHRE